MYCLLRRTSQANGQLRGLQKSGSGVRWSSNRARAVSLQPLRRGVVKFLAGLLEQAYLLSLLGQISNLHSELLSQLGTVNGRQTHTSQSQEIGLDYFR